MKQKTMKALRGFLVLMFFIPFVAHSQDKDPKDTLTKKLDSLSIKSLNQGQNNNTNPAVYEAVKVDVKTYFTLLGDDVKQQLTLPFHATGKQWLQTGGFALFAGGVALLNKPINRFAVNLHNNNTAVASASKYITNFGGLYEVYTLAGFYLYGTIFKTQKSKTTTLLATQAYIIAGAIQEVTKFISGEQRPIYKDPVTGKSSPIFHGPFIRFKKNANGTKYENSAFSSFPSGHTTAAFSAATVYALEYKDKPLIPILSYTAATLIGLSRLTENKHWPTDVLVGATLGYLSGKQVVNNYHRYSRIKHGQRQKPAVSFNFQYMDRQFIPGLVYNF